MGHKRFLGLLAAISIVALSANSFSRAEDKSREEKKSEKKSGTVVGVITKKGDSKKREVWIEVTADGEEKGRRYVPHWRGGAPKDGGGLDKEMAKMIEDLKVGQRIRLEWEFQE